MPKHLSSIYAKLGVRSQVDPIRTDGGMKSRVTQGYRKPDRGPADSPGSYLALVVREAAKPR